MAGGNSGGSTVGTSQLQDGAVTLEKLGASALAVTRPTVTTLIPRPNSILAVPNIPTFSGNTTLRVGMLILPFRIIVNKLSFFTGAVNTSGTFKVALFSSDGQTQYINETTATISGTNVLTEISLGASVTLEAGVYYIAILPVSTVSIAVAAWDTDQETHMNTLSNGPSGKARLAGTITVTADTMPATIDPTAITSVRYCCLAVRFDN